MTGSRRFLLLLLLASITCVVLVQISGDDPPFTQEARADGNFENLPYRNSTIAVDIEKQQSVIRPATTPLSAHSPQTTGMELLLKKAEGPTQSLKLSSKNVELKQPAIEKKYLKGAPHQSLISRQERVQELMKQKQIRKKPTLDPMRSLRPIPIVNPAKVTRIILITYFRSGSTFFGDILQQNWKTFYHFEPLHSMTYDRRIEDDKVYDVFHLFNGILRCNFTNQTAYMNWVKQPKNQFLFSRNLFLWVTCHGNPRLCFNASFVNSVCVRAPIHVVKLTRLHMRHLKTFMEANTDLNLKVVYLTRDPRGIASSRWSLEWCKGTNCSDAGVLCHEMEEDMRIFEGLQRLQPKNFIQVRYEDLSLNPENETQKLFQFLNLPFSTSVKKFLKTHTVGHKNDDKNPYSTRRNTTAMANSWRERFTYDQVVQVQSQCENVLVTLNHSTITSPDELPFPNGKPIIKKPVTVPPLMKQYHNNPLAKKYLAQQRSESSENLILSDEHVRISNNTNVEIHKTYKVVDKTSGDSR